MTQSRKKRHKLDLGSRTLIMGVLNVTPDSFFDGGAYFDKAEAVARAIAMERDGADIIDVGGESTRPGARSVGAEEQLRRVLPVIKALRRSAKIPVSIDTRSAAVAEAAICAGAEIVNDVSGLRYDPAMARLVAKHRVRAIIMHMRSTPDDMQKRAVYGDVVRDVIGELRKSVTYARRAGISRGCIIIDPGIGFAKTAEQNIEILSRLEEFKALRLPICVGVSRKSFIGAITGSSDPGARLAGSIAAGITAVMKGACILRVHDVGETRQAMMVADSILSIRKKER